MVEFSTETSAAKAPSWNAATRLFLSLARTDLEKFTALFRRLRPSMSDEITRACVYFSATHENTQTTIFAEKQILFWLSLRDEYVALLLNIDFLNSQEAKRAAVAIAGSDPYFFSKLRAGVSETSAEASKIRRALSFIAELGDFTVLLPWLRGLMTHADESIRSQAAKLICGLRPNRAFVERQLQSEDGRIRANAIEALWHVRTEDATAIFRMGLLDVHHRVRANALLGLFYQDDLSAVEIMMNHALDPEALTRAAMAWALGTTGDSRAVSILKTLAEDSDAMVQRQASKALSQFPNISESEQAVAILEETSRQPDSDGTKAETYEDSLLKPERVPAARPTFVPSFSQL